MIKIGDKAVINNQFPWTELHGAGGTITNGPNHVGLYCISLNLATNGFQTIWVHSTELSPGAGIWEQPAVKTNQCDCGATVARSGHAFWCTTRGAT